MKFVFTALLCLTAVYSKAQLNYLSRSQASVTALLKADTSKTLVEGSTLQNGDVSLLYDDKYMVSHGYIFRDGKCIKYIMGMSQEWYGDFVKHTIGTAFYKIYENEYMSENKEYKLKINFIDGSFYAVFERIFQ